MNNYNSARCAHISLLDFKIAKKPTNSTTSLYDRCNNRDPILIRKRQFSLMQTISGGDRAND